jgi:hypothetical protein
LQLSASPADAEHFCNLLHANLKGYKIKRCVSSRNANYGTWTPSHRTVMVVSHRETVIGCHSFHRFLIRDVETIFVLDEEFVRIWNLEQLVRDSDRNATLGAHLVITESYGGELMARNIALQFIDGVDHRLEYLLSVNCDVHEMPKSFNGSMGFEDMVKEFSRVLDSEKVSRKNNSTSVEIEWYDEKVVERDYFPVLAITAVHVEDSDGKVRHGVDVGNWLARGGIEGKPEFLENSTWISESSHFLETHLVFMDAQALKNVSSLYFLVESANPEHKILPGICNIKSFVLLQHNEIVVFIDFVNNSAQLQSNAYINYLNYQGLNDLLLFNFELLAERRNPKYMYDEFHTYRKVGIHMNVQYGLQFLVRFFRPHWIPSLNGRKASDPFVVRFINATMKLAGYSCMGTDGNGFSKYMAEICYPQTIPMVISQHFSGDHIAGIFLRGNSTYYLISNFPYRISFASLSKSNRTVSLPIFNDSIVEMLTSTVNGAFTEMFKLMPASEYQKSPICLLD